MSDPLRRRRWPALLTAAALLPLALVVPAGTASAAPTCTTTWASPVNGLWTDAARWTAGVPGSSSVACITAAGTYTVTTAGASVAGVVVGGASGLATLAVTGNCAVNAALTLGGPSETNARGRIDLSSDACGSYALLDGAGPLTGAGSLRVLAGAGGARYLRVPTTVTGTMDVSTGLTLDGSLLTVSGGTLSVTAAGSVGISGAGLTNGSGTVANLGAVTLSNGTWTQSAGTTTGNPPLITGGGLVYTGSGASTIAQRAGTVQGNIAAGQTLRVVGDCAANGAVSASTLTNRGLIELTSTCGSYALLGPTTGGATITTLGAGRVSLLAGASGGPRYVRLPVVVSGGTFAVGAGASGVLDFTGAVTVNGGSLTVAAGGTLDASGTTISAATGSVANLGAINVNNGTWGQGAATATGNPPLVTGGTVAYSGAGASTVVQRSGVVTGNVAAGQTLRIQGDCAVNAVVSLPTMTNAGRIELTSTGCGSYALVQPVVPGATLTSTGTVALLAGAGGPRYVRLPVVVPAGTFGVGAGADAQLDGTGAITTTGGTLDVAATGSLTTSGTTITNASGTVANLGTIAVNTGTWGQGAGTVTGNPPVVSGGTVAYSGSGASTIVQRSGSVTGNLAVGQTLRIQGDCAVNAGVSLPTMTNAGRIELTSTGCGTYALVQATTPGDQVTNTGTVAVLAGAGGPRYWRLALRNQATLDVEAGATMTVDGSGTFRQTSTGTTRAGVASATSFGRIAASSPVALAGTLAAQRLATYTPTTSQKWVVLTYPSKTGSYPTVKGAYGSRYFAATQAATSVTLLTRANPKVTALTPSSVARGAAAVPVTVSGSGFGAGTTLAVSGTGVTFGPVTVVDATTLTTTVTVTAGATVGARSVTVTRGAGTSTTAGALTIT